MRARRANGFASGPDNCPSEAALRDNGRRREREREREVSFFPRGKRTEESEISRREREGRERDMTKLCDTVDKLGEC